MSQLKALKLKTGEEIIGMMTEKETSVIVENPVLALVSIQGFNMLPFMPYVENAVYDFDRSDIMVKPMSVMGPVETKYREMFGLVQVPEKKILV